MKNNRTRLGCSVNGFLSNSEREFSYHQGHLIVLGTSVCWLLLGSTVSSLKVRSWTGFTRVPRGHGNLVRVLVLVQVYLMKREGLRLGDVSGRKVGPFDTTVASLEILIYIVDAVVKTNLRLSFSCLFLSFSVSVPSTTNHSYVDRRGTLPSSSDHPTPISTFSL